MLFATVVPIAYFLLYLKNKQVTFVFLKFVMAFVICLYWATYACTFFYSYYDVIGWFKILTQVSDLEFKPFEHTL